jgi:hypothetical protein
MKIKQVIVIKIYIIVKVISYYKKYVKIILNAN